MIWITRQIVDEIESKNYLENVLMLSDGCKSSLMIHEDNLNIKLLSDGD